MQQIVSINSQTQEQLLDTILARHWDKNSNGLIIKQKGHKWQEQISKKRKGKDASGQQRSSKQALQTPKKIQQHSQPTQNLPNIKLLITKINACDCWLKYRHVYMNVSTISHMYRRLLGLYDPCILRDMW